METVKGPLLHHLLHHVSALQSSAWEEGGGADNGYNRVMCGVHVLVSWR